jgi:hypothetical protein
MPAPLSSSRKALVSSMSFSNVEWRNYHLLEVLFDCILLCNFRDFVLSHVFVMLCCTTFGPFLGSPLFVS